VTRAIEIRPSSSADFEGIARLLDRRIALMDYERRLALWKWRWEANPQRADGLPPFLVASKGESIVGVHGLIPSRVLCAGQAGRAAFACDFAVDESARNIGLKLKVAAMGRDLCDVAISTSANDAAKNVTLALGGKTIPRSGDRYVCPLRPEALWPGRLRPSVLQGMGLSVRAFVSGRSRLGVNANRCRELTRPDESAERLWEASAARAASLVVVRDAGYLAWRYFDYPLADTVAFAVGEPGSLRALAIGQIGRDSEGRKALLLAELLFDAGELRAASEVLHAVLRTALRLRADYVFGRFSDQEVIKLLRTRGFLTRGRSSGEFTVKFNGLDTNLALERPYFTAGDGDCALLSPL
jgi:hypothetical protein